MGASAWHSAINCRAFCKSRLATPATTELPVLSIAFQFRRAIWAALRIPQRSFPGVIRLNDVPGSIADSIWLGKRRPCFGVFRRLARELFSRLGLSINADEQIAGSREFLAGVAEGFYGEPWDDLERQTLFDWMHKWGLNTYLYAPKDDLKQRAIWRELYSRSEVEKLKALIDQCEKKRIRFIYALSPGLDIGYSKGSDLDQLRRKFEQLTGLGCRKLAMLFDDITDGMLAEERKRFDSFASAQAHVANTVFEWTRKKSPDGRFLFCPTA